MSFFFLNPWMLLGLAGVGLPILVHLLNRRRFDVVEWGAMQFLEWQDASRRRIRLQDLLLLAIRIGLILLIALAMARPFVSGAALWALAQSAGHDVVLLIDGSTSMSAETDDGPGFDRSRSTARNFLDRLGAGDRVTVFDVRRQASRVSQSEVDPELARSSLEELLPPLGTARLADGLLAGLRELRTGTHAHRDLIVVTDGRRYGWQLDDPLVWARLEELRAAAVPPPKIWIVAPEDVPDIAERNRSLDPLELSRDEIVPGYPVTISTTVRGGLPGDVDVHLEIDGHRLPSRTRSVRLPAEGSATVEFTHDFRRHGMHAISVMIDDDLIVADNRADAAVLIHKQLRVLLVDGDPQNDPTKSEAFFASRAFDSRLGGSGWVQPRVVTSEAWSADDLNRSDVVILANAMPETDAQKTAMAEFVRSGGGLFLAVGDRTNAESATAWLNDASAPLLPVFVRNRLRDEAAVLTGVHVTEQSLALPWLDRFRGENGGSLETARFTAWQDVVPKGSPRGGEKPTSAESSTPQVVAKLNTGDAFLVGGMFGDGRLLLMTVPLDADESTLPAKRDYVPLLHEIVFFLSGSHGSFNVDAGSSAFVRANSVERAESYHAHGPLNSEWTVHGNEDARGREIVQLPSLPFPGAYHLEPESAPADAVATAPVFAARHDPGESDLAPLSDEERSGIRQTLEATFLEDPAQLAAAVYEEESQAELWLPLLLAFLGLMILETLMTRRLVRSGLADPESEDQDTADPDATRREATAKPEDTSVGEVG